MSHFCWVMIYIYIYIYIYKNNDNLHMSIDLNVILNEEPKTKESHKLYSFALLHL